MATKTTKKQPAKRKTAQKRTAHKEMKSFKVAKDTIPFTHTKPTKQTLYWIVLLSVIVIAQLWILSLQIEVANLTDVLMLNP